MLLFVVKTFISMYLLWRKDKSVNSKIIFNEFSNFNYYYY